MRAVDGYNDVCVSFAACYANVIECRVIGSDSPKRAFEEWKSEADDICELLDDYAYFYVKKGEESSGDVYCFSRDEQTDTFPDDEMTDEDMARMSSGEEVQGYTRITAADAYSRLIFRSASVA